MDAYYTNAYHDLTRDCAHGCQKIYKAEDVDARIAELEQQLAYANDAAAKGDLARANAGGMQMTIAQLEKALRAASRWLHRNVLNDVMAPEMMTDTDGFSSEYLNDLADMRAVRSLMGR